MKYALLFQQTEDIVEYTMSVVRHLMTMNGHEVCAPDDADIICVSVCDVTQIKFAEQVRKKYPDTKKAHDFVTELKMNGGWPFKALPTSGVKDTLLRNALCYTTNADEYALYNELRMPKVEARRVLSALLDVFFRNDYSASVKINHRASDEYGRTKRL